MEINKIHNIDALKGLKQLPNDYIDCSMSSPPYWALRDYGIEPQIWDGDKDCEHSFDIKEITNPNDRGGKSQFDDKGIGAFMGKDITTKSHYSGFCTKCQAWKGSLGLEPTFDLFIKHLCDIYDEVKRVLKPSGTCWVNLGDTYANKNPDKGGQAQPAQGVNRKGTAFRGYVPDMQEKCQICIPFRFAIEMINRGWILRNTIIWHKPNCMPSSAKDRFTVDFEYVFFFVKQKKYFFEPQYDKQSENTHARFPMKMGQEVYKPAKEGSKELERPGFNDWREDTPQTYLPQGRNKRTVWSICPQPFPEAHFAVYPEELCQTPIKSGCPEFVCKKCGKAREKVYDVEYEYELDSKGNPKKNTHKNKMMWREGGKTQFAAFAHEFRAKRLDIPKGYTQCSCNAGFEGGIILDSFIGAGTTALVALKQNKRFIGFEINKQYIDIANKRIKPYLEQRKLTDIIR